MTEQELTTYLLKARVRMFYTILVFLAGLATISVLALAGTIYFPTKTEPAVLSAFIAITSGIVGSVTTVVMNAIQANRRLTPRDAEAELHPEKLTDEPTTPNLKVTK